MKFIADRFFEKIMLDQPQPQNAGKIRSWKFQDAKATPDVLAYLELTRSISQQTLILRRIYRADHIEESVTYEDYGTMIIGKIQYGAEDMEAGGPDYDQDVHPPQTITIAKLEELCFPPTLQEFFDKFLTWL